MRDGLAKRSLQRFGLPRLAKRAMSWRQLVGASAYAEFSIRRHGYSPTRSKCILLCWGCQVARSMSSWPSQNRRSLNANTCTWRKCRCAANFRMARINLW